MGKRRSGEIGRGAELALADGERSIPPVRWYPRTMRTLAALLLTVVMVGSAWGQTTRPAIVSAAEWGSKPQPMPESKKQVARYITIHHEGVLWKPKDDAVKKLIALQEFGQKQKGWEDIPYHFVIAPDGRIFECRSVDYMPESNTKYDRDGHIGIELMGNFEEQRVNEAQLAAAVRLVAWLCDEYRIDPDSVATHKDRAPGQTVCPGKDFYRYVSGGPFKGWVKDRLDGKALEVKLLPPLEKGPTVMIGEALPTTRPSPGSTSRPAK